MRYVCTRFKNHIFQMFTVCVWAFRSILQCTNDILYGNSEQRNEKIWKKWNEPCLPFDDEEIPQCWNLKLEFVNISSCIYLCVCFFFSLSLHRIYTKRIRFFCLFLFLYSLTFSIFISFFAYFSKSSWKSHCNKSSLKSMKFYGKWCARTNPYLEISEKFLDKEIEMKMIRNVRWILSGNIHNLRMRSISNKMILLNVCASVVYIQIHIKIRYLPMFQPILQVFNVCLHKIFHFIPFVQTKWKWISLHTFRIETSTTIKHNNTK